MSNETNAHVAAAARSRQNAESDLDRALEDTFPASDPIAVGRATANEAPSRPIDRRAPIIDAEAVERARASPQRRFSST